MSVNLLIDNISQHVLYSSTLLGTIVICDIIQPPRNWQSSHEDQTDRKYHKAALYIPTLHTSGINGEMTAPLLPPSSITFLARAPSQLEIRFYGVWIHFPFPNHFIFLYLKFSNYEIVPVWLSMSSSVWLYDLSFPTLPIGLLLSSPKAHGSGSGALHSILFKSCTMDVENNHSMPLIPRPPKSTTRIAMLAAAGPSAKWLPSTCQRRGAVQSGPDAQEQSQ